MKYDVHIKYNSDDDSSFKLETPNTYGEVIALLRVVTSMLISEMAQEQEVEVS